MYSSLNKLPHFFLILISGLWYMEKNTGFNLMKPYYYTQLEIVKDYINLKKFNDAIQLLSTLIEQLHEDMITFKKMNIIDIKKVLKTCYMWQEYYYFMWLMDDPDDFQQNRTLNVKNILQGYQKLLSNETLYHSSEYEIYIRFYIVRLLFEEHINLNVLGYMRQYFCTSFDKFQQMKQLQYQALTLSGLALVASHEGDIVNAYQGLASAKTLYPTLNNFIQMMHCEISNIHKRTKEKVGSFVEPLLISNHLASMPRP